MFGSGLTPARARAAFLTSSALATLWTGITCGEAAVLDLNGHTVYLATSPSPVFGNRSYIYGTGDVTNNGGSFAYLVESGAPAGATYSGTVSDGTSPTALVHASGSLTILTPQTYTELTLVQSGTLALGGAGSIASSQAIFLAGSADTTTFDISQTTSSATVTNIYGSSTIALGSKTLTITNGNGFLGGPIQDGGLGGGIGGSLVISGQMGLYNDNTYTGTTTITASGYLYLADCACSSQGIATSSGVVDNGVFDISNLAAGTSIRSLSSTEPGFVILGANALTLTNAAGTFDGILYGTGDLVVSGGTETLTADNSLYYSGDTMIGRGATIVVGDSGALGTGSLLMSPNSALGFTTGGIVLANSVALSGDPTITVAAGNTDTVAGQITDATPGQSPGILEKSGGGTLILTAVNSYSGGTIVTAGTLQLAASATLGAGTAFVNVISGTLDLGGTVQTTGALTVQGGSIVNGTLVSSAFGVQAGIIGAILTGAGALTKSGTGTTVLTGANSYSGGTTIIAGTLQIGSGGATGSIAGNVVDHGLLAFNRSDAISFSGSISGSGGLAQIGPGTLTLSGTNSYSGPTTVGGGTLAAGSAGAFSSSSAFTVNAGTTLDLAGFDQTIGSLGGGGTATNNGASAARLTLGGNDGSTLFSGALRDGRAPLGLGKSGSGTLILTGASTYSGGTTIMGGTLQIGAGGTTGSIRGSVVDNATIVFDRPDSLIFAGTISGTGALIQAGTGTLVLAGENTYSGGTTIAGGTLQVGAGGATGSISGAVTDAGTLIFARSNATGFSGVVTGSGGVVQSGPGRLTLSGKNLYAGPTVVAGGTLRAGAVGALSPNSDVTVATGARLDVGGLDQTIGSLAGSGIVINGGTKPARLAAGGSQVSTHFSGVLLDGGAALGLTKTGAGTLVLSGANLYSGATLVAGGTLAAGASQSFSRHSAVTVDRGAALDLSGFSQTVGSLAGAGTIGNAGPVSATLTVGGNNNSTIFAGTIQDDGQTGLTKVGSGTLTLSGVNTYSGPTLVSAGTLDVRGSIANSRVTVENGATLSGSGNVGGLALGAGSVMAPGSVTPYHTLLVQGDLDFSIGSSLRIFVDGSGRTDSVAVSGRGRLGGASLDIRTSPGIYSPTTLYKLVTAAGGVSGRFGSISSDSGLAFMRPILSYDRGSVTLSFNVSPGMLASVAATRNQSATAIAIQGLPLGNPFYTLVLNQTIAGARQAFDASSGEIHASAVTAAIEDSHLIRDAITDRLDAADPSTIAAFAALGGLSVAPPPRPYAFWGQGFGDFGRNGGDHNAATLDRSVGGFILGGDATLAGPLSSWRVGIAGAFTTDTLDVKDRASSGGVETIHGLFYAGARYGAIDVRIGAGGGATSTIANRAVLFSGFTDVDHSYQGGSLLQAFGEAGYRFTVAHAVIEPTAAAAAIHVHEHGFHEDGGAAALLGFGQDQTVGVTTLGVKGEIAMAVDMPLFGHAFIGWRHAFGSVDPLARLALTEGSATFTVAGAPIDRDALAAKVGLDWRATPDLTVGASYLGQIGARAQDHALQGKLEISF